jgi:hypothetical protein
VSDQELVSYSINQIVLSHSTLLHCTLLAVKADMIFLVIRVDSMSQCW